MPTIAECQLRKSELPEQESAALDIDLLLCHLLDKPRYYLYAHADDVVDGHIGEAFDALLSRRKQGEPLAYIIGQAEFWSLPLAVSKETLIPRPDTECLVEYLLDEFPENDALSVLDLGTGTGAIALALASERSQWQVLGVDRIEEAVALAERNAKALKIDNARFIQSNWFESVDGKYNIIVSNPPYIEAEDPHLSRDGVRFEPASALVAGVDGLDDIRQIAEQAFHYLTEGGVLLLEHGYRQSQAVAAILEQAGFCDIGNRRDYAGNPRATYGRKGPIKEKRQ